MRSPAPAGLAHPCGFPLLQPICLSYSPLKGALAIVYPISITTALVLASSGQESRALCISAGLLFRLRQEGMAQAACFVKSSSKRPNNQQAHRQLRCASIELTMPLVLSIQALASPLSSQNLHMTYYL